MSEGPDDLNSKKDEDGFKKKEKDKSKKDKKDVKGYVIFGEDESADELVGESSRSFGKLKKPKSFKFSKKEKDEKKEKKEKGDNDKKEKNESSDKKSKSGKKSKSELEKLEKKLKSKEKNLNKKGEKEKSHKWSKKPSKTVVKSAEETIIFGVPLYLAVERNPSHDGVMLPAIVRECIDYISEYGIASEGIYRVSGVKSKVHHLKDLYNAGTQVYLVDHEPNVVSSLLKLFLRELPEPVLTHRLIAKFEAASIIKDSQQQLKQFKTLIAELPLVNQTLLAWIILHMTDVIDKEKLNKMNLQNLSIVLSPTMKISHRVLNVLFTFSRVLFKDTIIKRYIPPMRPASSKWTLDLPENKEALMEELVKQESLLDHIHEGLTNQKHPGLEEQLWEVQRVVTQLKRKLKHLKQLELVEADPAVDTSTSMPAVLDKRYPTQKLKLIKTLHNSPQVLKRLNDQLHNDNNLGCRLSDIIDQMSLTDQPYNNKHGSSFKGKSTSSRHSLDRKGSDLSRKHEAKRHSSTVSDRSLKVDSKRSSRIKVDSDRQSKISIISDQKLGEACELKGDEVADEKVVDGGVKPKEEQVGGVRRVAEVEELSINIKEPDADAISEMSQPEPLPYEKLYEEEEEEDRIDDDYDSIHAYETKLDLDLEADNEIQHTLGSRKQKMRDVLEDEEEYKRLKDESMGSNLDLSNIDTSSTSSHSPSSSVIEDPYENFEKLLNEYNYLLMQEEELIAIGDETRQKIATELNEIERMKQDISELHLMRRNDDSSLSSSSSSSSSLSSPSIEDEERNVEERLQVLERLVQENKRLEKANADVSSKIHNERMACLEVKLQIRIIQQRNNTMSYLQENYNNVNIGNNDNDNHYPVNNNIAGKYKDNNNINNNLQCKDGEYAIKAIKEYSNECENDIKSGVKDIKGDCDGVSVDLIDI